MMSPRVELVYFPDCPHVDAARKALREALAAEGLPLQWREWNRGAADTPEAYRRKGSPAILINGCDIEPIAAEAACCRVYADGNNWLGIPTVPAIRTALHAVQTPATSEADGEQ